jgi:hypothetical protein
MAIAIVEEKLTKEDVQKAKEEYETYIKITVDLEQETVAIGGEYHADTEKLLIEEHKSKQKDIWGGGYSITNDKFETNAIINIRPNVNNSMEILDPEIREQFLDLVEKKLGNIRSFI